MAISRDFQEDFVAKVQSQFYEAMVADEKKCSDAAYVKNDMQDVVMILRFNILNFYFEDDLLLKLFGMLDETINYLDKLEEKYPSHSLSA